MSLQVGGGAGGLAVPGLVSEASLEGVEQGSEAGRVLVQALGRLHPRPGGAYRGGSCLLH